MRNNTKRRYEGNTPGMVYSVTMYAENKQGAKRELRKMLCLQKLPTGTAVWLAG